MAFDFKKEYKEFYMPKNKPVIVNVPEANYIAVRGEGNPNEEGGAYQQAIGVLYAIAYTLRMSYKTDYKIEGFFEYVVPPLEGFWWQDDIDGVNYADKDSFHWISVIRLPDFVNEKDFEWAVETATKKKKIDCSSAEFLTIDEGLCVQIMHLGSFDDEPATVALMDEYLKQNDYKDTILYDPSGFDTEAHTTVLDLKEVVMDLLKNEWFKDIVSQTSYTATLPDGSMQTWKNTNTFLDPTSEYYNKNVIGVKTGSLSDDFNLVVLYKKHGKEFLICSLGSQSNYSRYDDVNYVLKTIDESDYLKK